MDTSPTWCTAIPRNCAPLRARPLIGPGRGWVDPVKEPAGEVLKLDAALTMLSNSTSTISGRYYLDILDERTVEQAQMKIRGMGQGPACAAARRKAAAGVSSDNPYAAVGQLSSSSGS
jgi:capsid protein